MDLYELYQYLLYLANKSQKGFKLRITDYVRNLKISNFEYFAKVCGLSDEFQPGMPFSKSAMEVSQIVTDKMHRFKKIMGDTNMPLQIDSDGHATIPTDYLHIASLGYKKFTTNPDCITFTEDMRPIEILTEGQWNHRLQSSVNPPSEKYPIIRFMSDYIEFRPKTLQLVDFVYLRKPVDPFLDYNIDANDDIQYLQATSTQLEWNEYECIQIAHMILAKVGINLSNVQLQQSAELFKAKGV